jgi:putative ABC transport system permease protein
MGAGLRPRDAAAGACGAGPDHCWAVLIGWLGSGLVAGFSLLAGLLLGRGLALPLLLSLALAALRPLARGPFAEWVLADSRQQLPALSLSLMALLLALSANIGVATMVGSFRTTFTGWLDQRLASELYVFTADTEEAARLATFLDGRADALLPILSAEARLFEPARRGLRHRRSRHLPRGLAAPVGHRRPVGRALRRRRRSGERTDGAAARPVAGRSGALSPDLTLPLSRGLFRLRQPGRPGDRGDGGLPRPLPRRARPRISPSACRPRRPRRSRRLLREEFGLPETSVRNQAQIKAFSLEIFENTFRVTGAL